MPTIKLTKKWADSAPLSDHDQVFWDTALAGFGLKVTARGTKTYVVQYRLGGRGTATKRMTIGRHLDPWDTASARSEAERILRLVKSGQDPQLVEQQRLAQNVEFAFDHYAERFLTEYASRKWGPRTYATGSSNFRRWIIPSLGSIPLASITRRNIANLFDGMPHGSHALARTIFAHLRKVFSWAVERGDLDRSPMDGLKSPPAVRSRDRVLNDAELLTIMLATMRPEMKGPFRTFMHFLIITGQRRDEVARLDWKELDRNTETWLLPEQRSKNHYSHLVPLTRFMIAELDGIAFSDIWPRSGPVFTTNGRTPISGYSRMKRRLDTLASAGANGGRLAPWRLHDIRRTVATNLQRLGVRFEVTEALLNHVSGARSGVAGVYQRHDWKDEKRAALALWSERVSNIIEEAITTRRLSNIDESNHTGRKIHSQEF